MSHDLQHAAEDTARLLDEITDSFADELHVVLQFLRQRIRGLLRELRTDSGRIATTRVNLALALQLRQRLLEALRGAGYHDLVAAASDAPMDRLAARILAAVPQAQMAAFDVEALVALKRVRFEELLLVADDAAAALWRTVVDGVVGARPLSDLVDDLADLLETSEKRARTIYDTAASTFTRQVAQMGATGEPDELFFYVGPVDGRMRPFCRERVGKVYTRADIDAMDNGQLPNVMVTGGGYNCRHLFQRVSPFDQELIDLAGTGERQADIERRMQDSRLATGVAA